MESGEQRSFWDRHITAWSSSAYEQGKKLAFLEKITRPFRKHMKARQEMGVAMLQEWSPVAVAELGCRTGEFAAAALQTCSAIRRYVAIDFSEAAIARARERVRLSAVVNVEAKA